MQNSETRWTIFSGACTRKLVIESKKRSVTEGAVLVSLPCKVEPMTKRAPKTRDDLFELLKLGLMNPEEAECEAARLGLKPLRQAVATDGIDVMAEGYWTIPMACAWVLTRQPSSVRVCWPLWRALDRQWLKIRWATVGEQRDGYVLASRSLERAAIVDAGVLDKAFESHHPSELDIIIDQSLDLVWRNLETGNLRAEAWGRGLWSDIPSEAWKSLRYDWVRDVVVQFPDFDEAPYGANVLLRTADILGLWPSAMAPAPAGPNAVVTKKDAARRQMVAQALESVGDAAFGSMPEKDRYAFLRKWFADRSVSPPARTTLQKTLKALGILSAKKSQTKTN